MPDDTTSMPQSEAEQAVAQMLRTLLPAGAESLTMRSSVLATVRASRFTAVFRDGRRESINARGRVSSRLLNGLRSAMYRADSGTWFSMVMTVAPGGEIETNYDDDTEPDFGFGGVDPVAYANDAKVFPRSLAHQPDWLRQRIAEGRRRQDG